MATLMQLAEDRSDLGADDIAVLTRLVEQWSPLADLALSDLILWVPTWNDGGAVAVAQVRPTTAPTAVPEDIVGTFAPRGRHPQLDQAVAFARAVIVRDIQHPWVPSGVESYPIRRDGRVIAVLVRHASSAPRVAGLLEEIYLSSADDLLTMLVDGRFPVDEVDQSGTETPRVGDGLVRLAADGTVSYASPNAISALRRLGLATEVVGSEFEELVVRLSHRPGPMDEALTAVASGRAAGRADIENTMATVLVRGIPVIREDQQVGAIVFLQDVTDLRRRERALISKDATIREIHHRVKNNLQTVAAMLRLQGRRASSVQAQEALAEAELRVAAIAVVHESLSAEAGERVDFDAVVDRILGLVRDLAPAFADGGPTPTLTREGSWGSLPADLATPLAMTVSELLHNAVEHAGADRVSVDLGRDAASDDLVMQVFDDGCGLPEGFDTEHAGLGLSIVQSLITGDLHGSCRFSGPDDEVDASTGTRVRIQVPVPA